MGTLTRSVVVVVVVAMVVTAFGEVLVGAQYTSCATVVVNQFASQCHTYFNSPTLMAPDPSCSAQLRSMQTFYGALCYCELFVAYKDPGNTLLDMQKACNLPRDCNVVAEMCSCPCSGIPSTTPSMTPSGVIATPPGLPSSVPTWLASSTVPVTGAPTTTSASSSSSSSSSSGGGSSSLAVPIGASVGGMSAVGLVIYLIM